MSYTRKHTPQDTLVGQILAVLNEAGIPRAEWDDNGKITQEGYDVMMGMRIRYVDNPHVPVLHEAKIDEIMALLKGRFHDKTVEIDGSRWWLAIRRMGQPSQGWSELDICMQWRSHV